MKGTKVNTRRAGLLQAARICKKEEALWDSDNAHPIVGAFYSGRAQQAMSLRLTFERLAREEK